MASRFLASSLRNMYKVSRGSQPRVSTAFLAKRHASEGGIARDEDQVTGLEKQELDKMLEGDLDPFNMKLYTGPGGTKANPTKVPSMDEERIVGCICEEDATYIQWMILKKGEPQRCDCGYFFELTPGLPYNISS